MKKCVCMILVLALCLFLCSCAAYIRRSRNDVAGTVQELAVTDNIVSGCNAGSYTMDITLDTENDTVYGTSVVELTNTTSEALSQVCFRLYSANISSGVITSARNPETGKEYKIRTKGDPSVIYISLEEDALQPNAAASVKLEFESAIPSTCDRFGHLYDPNGDLYHLTFCFPQLAFLENGKWHEDMYFENGESYYYEMTDYHVTLHAPSEYAILSSGKSQTANGLTVIDAPNVREMAITACNFAQIYTTETQGITINLLAPAFSNYDTDCLENLYDILLTLSADALEIYSSTVGSYIYDELDVIPTFFDGGIGGMEMPGLVQIGMDASHTGQQLPYHSYLASITSLVHEIGHQWFYCAVGNNTSKEPWLDESFTSYLQRLYFCKSNVYQPLLTAFAEKYDADFYTEGNYLNDSLFSYDGSSFCFFNEYEASGYVNLPVTKYSNRNYGLLVYTDGSWLLRELELCMGSERFTEMLGDWYADNNGCIVTGREFIAHLLKYDSSNAVKAILNEYLLDQYF